MRTATVLNTILTPKLTAIKGMNIAFGFGFFLTLFSFVDLIILNKIDADMEKKMGA